MKRFTIILSILTIYSSVLWSQDYLRLLEIPDLTEVQQSDIGQITENTVAYDPIVAEIINQTNLDSLVSYVRILSGEDSVWIGNNKVLIRSRGGAGGNQAASYIKQKLSSYNLEVYEQNYSSTGRNIYAVQEGYLYPEKKYIFCAHYDAVDVYCADDNASGVAAVIEAARILSTYDIKYTLIYAVWDEEEIGLVGSNYYASQASSGQEQIQGVINMDMLGWDGNNDGLLDIHTQDIATSNSLANSLLLINDQYGLQLNPVVYNPGTWQSDHSSFWNNGYGAILLIEAYYGGDLNPYYHSVNDRIDKFNLPYFHKMSKLAIGALTSLIEATSSVRVDDRAELPIVFELQQNYPNPFNPVTKISWQSPVGSHQTIKVFDVLGNEIATLVDEYKPAGRYEVEFQSSVGSRQPAYRTGRLASGIYFYQLRAGEYTSVKKMILIK